MPVSKLLIAGVVGVGAVGLALSDQIKLPWRDAPAHSPSFANKLGYLAPAELPNTIALLSSPPAEGSEAMKRDEEARTAALSLKDTARYSLAAADAVRDHANTVDAFACAFGTDISTKRTPRLYELLSRLRLDVRAASYSAKGHFKRPRPFATYNAHTCYPADEAMVRNDGSYPSARGAVGWAYALVLAELRPDRADNILRRGRDFGQSRVICDEEWASDVAVGEMVATATLDRMKANEAFRADLAAARQEVSRELAEGIKPARNCAAEFAVLASR